MSFLSRPLVRRQKRSADQKAMIAAFERIDSLAMGQQLLPEVVKKITAIRRDKNTGRWNKPDYAKNMVWVTRVLYLAGRISHQEYVFLATRTVENIHEDRMLDYDEIKVIFTAQDAIRKKYKLKPSQYWAKGDEPGEYRKLDNQFEKVYEKLFIKTLREFDLNDLANLKENEPKEYESAWERGRRCLRNKKEIIPAIKDVVIRFENDAKKAASVKAYSATITSLGAATEGLLLLRCLQSKKKSIQISKKLSRDQRPHNEDITTWKFEVLINVCSVARWFTPVFTSKAQYNPADFAHKIRRMRNYVHPGRLVRENPWLEINVEDYLDAEAFYTLLITALKTNKFTKSKKSPLETRNTMN
jgi:hypothetical protein